MVLDTESEGIILVTFLQYFCKTESYSVRQTAPGWSLSLSAQAQLTQRINV